MRSPEFWGAMIVGYLAEANGHTWISTAWLVAAAVSGLVELGERWMQRNKGAPL